ncbi:hypothetical protein EW146_g1766 [Bondarzewia mesenterica]|uniref:Methyltransferase domain-containing protein n=1 Tax=Bondarzewia mesenterica TaxID=1095465 RepID=A0A4S4M2Y6_9AGAM|nr:hypothetical protein EW146_g1766 [Bondarzewia mesenterica]
MAEASIQALVLVGGIVLICLAIRSFAQRSGPNLDSIPAVGFEMPILCYITAICFFWDSQNIIEKGYRKHKGGLFKIAMLDHWLVVASDIQSIEDIRRVPDDVLSFEDALFLFLQSDYTIGPQMRLDRYHTHLIRTSLTRNIAAIFADMHEELVSAFNDKIPVTDRWFKFPALETFTQIVCRMSNRVFVGAPTCRNVDYQELNMQFTVQIVKAAFLLKAFPEYLKPFAALIFSNVRSCTRQCAKHIAPLIEERRAKERELGKNWCNKPNDLLMWCMDEARGNEQEIQNIALRILLINFAAIHTTSTSLTFALYHLAAYPQFIRPLRKEVEVVLAAEGWSKSTLTKMRKIDSFLKETIRINTPGLWAMQRLSLKPFTFSNGHTIPAGTMIACPVISMHHDDAHHPNAHEFNPWRFSDIHQGEGKGHKNQFSSTSPEYLAFGHGKHACPGRFFAASELKAMLAHIVLTYDVRFEDGKTKPPNVYLGPHLVRRMRYRGVCTPTSLHYAHIDTFPKLDENRLDSMHEGITGFFGNRLSFAPLEKANPTSILELGSGTGAWQVILADTYKGFPEADVLAVDISSLPPRHLPPNLRFQIVDLTKPFPFENESFDVVHARLVMMHLPGGADVLRRVFALVKPGGWLIVEDPDDENARDGDGPIGPALHTFFRSWINILRSRGAQPCIGSELEQIIVFSGQFSEVNVRKVSIPLSEKSNGASFHHPLSQNPALNLNRSADPLENALGQTWKENMKRNACDFPSRFSEQGITAEVARKALEELDDPAGNLMTDMYFTWSRKRVPA